MPAYDVPVDCLLESEHGSVVGDNDKTELSSLRSCSPKSSSSCFSDEVGSSVSDASFERSAALLLDLGDEDGAAADTSSGAGSLCGLEEELSLLCEEKAEELMAQGADMRHVLCTSWKLQPKMEVGLRVRKGAASSSGQQALRDATTVQKRAIVQVEFERYSARANPTGIGFRGRGNGLRSGRPPPGFERRCFDSAALLTDVSPASLSGPTPILVSYADGSNTLSMASEPLVLHDITVSCVADTCHLFLSQMKNPTFAGLEPLEAAMFEAYNSSLEMEAGTHQLLRPIAAGSLLAVFSDEKWYRCQVVAYHAAADTCDIKFVDHGGYTTVSVAELRPLRSDFVRLPFQTIEVYVAAIGSAQDEIMIDIAADLLFRKQVSVQLLGSARDGVPVVQIYFYQNDYIHLLTQEILNDCYRTYLRAHPDHVVVVPEKTCCLEEEEDEGSVCCSEGTTFAGDESGIGTGSEPEEEEPEDWSQQVENWSEADSTLAADMYNADAGLVGEQHNDAAAAAYMPVVYHPDFVYAAAEAVQPVYYVQEQPCVPVVYYVPDPSGAPCFYPVVAAAPLLQPAYVEGEFYPTMHDLQHREDVPCSPYEEETEVVEQDSHCEVEEDGVAVDERVANDHAAELAALLSKPYEEWSQEDYERYYLYEESQ